eukprot:1325858-Pyramimonas_sp.AAC.2
MSTSVEMAACGPTVDAPSCSHNANAIPSRHCRRPCIRPVVDPTATSGRGCRAAEPGGRWMQD